MRLGILNAISQESSQVNWGGTPVDVYVRYFKSVDPPFDYAGYEVTRGQFPDSPGDCDAYVITGSLYGVYDTNEWIATLAQFIRDSYQAGKKLVGICFGHQILAHALGGRAERSEKGWGFGLKTFDIISHKAWMTEKPERCSLYFVHQDQVTRLPPEAELLGGNAFCPNAFYTIDNRVLSIQGHPEFSGGIMQDLLALKKEDLGPPEYVLAARSLKSGKPDNKLVAEWMVSFLTANSDR
jgi:GMP synthase-like glutamine amidotransferase